MKKIDNGDISSTLGLLVRIVRKWSGSIPNPSAPALDFKIFAHEDMAPLIAEAMRHADVLDAIMGQRYFADGCHSAIYQDDEYDPPLYVDAPLTGRTQG